jgi:hypothetical protein
MDARELLGWLKSLLVWTPPGSAARVKIQELINQLKQHVGQ